MIERRENSRLLQIYTQQLRTLYAEYHAAYLKALAGKDIGASIHADRERLIAMDRVAALEKTIREELGITAYIDVLPATWSAFNKERESVREMVMQKHRGAISQMQQMRTASLSLSERAASPAAIELDEIGIAFGLLYSNANGAALLSGGRGYVHQDIREMLWGDEGQSFDTRPAVSGLVVPANGRQFFVSDSENPDLIWPSKYLQIEKHSITVPVVGVTDSVNVKEVRDGIEGRLYAPILENTPLERAVLLSNVSFLPLTLKNLDMDSQIAMNAMSWSGE